MRAKLYRGYWYAVWTEDGRTRRKSLHTRIRAEADRRLAESRRIAAIPGETIAEIMQAYLRERDQTAVDPDRLRVAWKALEPSFGALRPDQIDRPICRAYIARRRREGRQDGTIAKELKTLRAGLNWHDPRSKAVFQIPPMPQPLERHLSRDEYRRLLKAARPAPHLRLFIILALATAGRSQAILGLTWNRVDFARGLIQLADDLARRKGRATVPMNAAAQDALEAAYEVRTSDYVIEWGGRQVAAIRKAYTRACERAGLHDVTPHTLRHTAAVWMAEAGVPMPEIAAYLGHADSRITERVYAKFSPNYLRRAARALE